ncbi:hypothetical protein [Sulfitobacter sabulilitoris]|uniref:Uncharacterized protein n=1 Tax=Sulfitobacter sabulilitoris TaxID=2562655 RepID=A0A5S3Q3U3_9RHOB|nr:hypothetical protein [Sulfitobacter sabulilitoris]TMM51191.1 hypothetical protein FDT80_15125 [Sulfitobacter sabulilitoris]
MTDPAPTVTRILVGATSYADAASALHIARRLVQARNVAMGGTGNLGGLLVQQNEVIAICGLPNRFVVSASGAVAMAPTLGQVRRLLAADARAFRERLAEIAGSPGAGWSFEQQIGDLVDRAVEAARTWDVLIFGYRRVHAVPGQVLVLRPDRPDGAAAMRLGATLAHDLRTDLVAIDVGGAPRGQAEVGHQTTLRVRDFETALARITRTNVQAVVVDLAHGPLRTHDDLRQLIEAARCPVVVLGAASERPALPFDTLFPPVTPRGAVR